MVHRLLLEFPLRLVLVLEAHLLDLLLVLHLHSFVRQLLLPWARQLEHLLLVRQLLSPLVPLHLK